MSKLAWDESGKHFYEAGVSKGVLYPASSTTSGTYEKGVAWSGLTTVTDSPSGAEATPLYADNIKYLNLMSAEEYEGSIEAYTYPDEFAACDGSAELTKGVSIGQQDRKQFAICYRTEIGNDVSANAGYKLHIVYGCIASPSERAHSTVNDSPEAMSLSWDIKATPVSVSGFKPTATIVIDSTKVDAAKLKLLEDKLYGGADQEPTLLLPDEIKALVGVAG
jgi:hypothetical protein